MNMFASIILQNMNDTAIVSSQNLGNGMAADQLSDENGCAKVRQRILYGGKEIGTGCNRAMFNEKLLSRGVRMDRKVDSRLKNTILTLLLHSDVHAILSAE